MSRALAKTLVLVNWKGVFYERYLLDRHVTALEGANGAGKTTVMIAAYVVLLPDMSRLRFTNLGETGATGGDKGIWGRLGEFGPSYAVLDFALAGRGRVIAGVHLERKGEPSVEPTPFLITGLGDDIPMQDLLLTRQGDGERVPELGDLRENAARLGGRLQSFTSAKDYFIALFDQGVTPLRLATDEERNKLNEMLRTSMTGGISRTLTSELRGFLLKEEGGLANTLQRMKANLDACRRTRIEVQESRRLEREIGEVFEAGQKMFVAAFQATRERADELERRVADAEIARGTARDALAAAEDALAGVVAELESSEARRAESESHLVTAKEWHERSHKALTAASEVTLRRRTLDAAEANTQQAAEERAVADSQRQRRREDLGRAQKSYERAALGLANVQEGLAELHHRAGAYQQSTRRLREAEALLQEQTLPTAELDARLVFSRSELDRVDSERREASALLADADEHRRQHAQLLATLCDLVSRRVSAAEAHSIATEALKRHRDQCALAERAPTLAQDLSDARKLAERQARVSEQAAKLNITLGSAPAGVVVAALLVEAESERDAHDEDQRVALAQLASCDRVLKELEAQQRKLVDREPAWRDLETRAMRLAEHLGTSLADRADLDRARSALGDQLTAARSIELAARETHEQLLHDARALLAAGGPFEPELLKLRDLLGADLVAASFEEASLEEAGLLEARLGPLAQGLVVDDMPSAARAASARHERLHQVWLVPREADLEELASAAPSPEVGSQDVLVKEGLGVRVSRIPARPRLGRRAREKRANDLFAEAEVKARELEGIRSKRLLLKRLVEDGEALLAGRDVWLAGDPVPELSEARRRMREVGTQIEVLQTTSVRHAELSRSLRPRIDGLRGLLSNALLLDPPDHARRAEELESQHLAALAAQAEVLRAAPLVAQLDDNLATLRRLPLAADALVALQERVEALRRDRDRLGDAAEALEYVLVNLEALNWSDAPARLMETQSLVPALEAQLRDADAAQEAARRSASDADFRLEGATSRWQDADGQRRIATQEHEAAQNRFEAFGIPRPTEEAVEAAHEEVTRIERDLKAQNTRRDELLGAQGERRKSRDNSQEDVKQAEEKLASERREAEPATARWKRLHGLAVQHRLLGNLLAASQDDTSTVGGSVNLMRAAHVQRGLLMERLKGAQGGATLLAELTVLRDTSDAEFADAYLELWLTVRDWLRHRLPAQVAEVDDPSEALLRLRDQLASLDERLSGQESRLRGESEDVAHGIDVQIRKARGQVNRLTKNLDGISFGSIQSIRVRLQPIEKMEQVLRALHSGEAQGLLFQGDLPIEEALDAIFQRYGGGRSGGHRLLDYREYVHLQVEIRRKAGTDWEMANPNKLSTGEAIGVGAALMMVILTEWERDANLLRGKKALGSLRFLFLDEANRLSHDNLGVLFELCKTLDLQLLIAAPEVARAEGNTTYRLVRRVKPDGGEEVLVSGRRTRMEA
jgi:chromosome partition protein MukB